MISIDQAERELLALGEGRTATYNAGADDALDALITTVPTADTDAWRAFLRSLDDRDAEYQDGVEDAARAVQAVIRAVRGRAVA